MRGALQALPQLGRRASPFIPLIGLPCEISHRAYTVVTGCPVRCAAPDTVAHAIGHLTDGLPVGGLLDMAGLPREDGANATRSTSTPRGAALLSCW